MGCRKWKKKDVIRAIRSVAVIAIGMSACGIGVQILAVIGVVTSLAHLNGAFVGDIRRKKMVKTKLTVTASAKLHVDRKTAETCLRLVEAFVNANPVDVEFHKRENGELEFNYVFHEVKEYGK